jgi:hypothetical protein
MTDSPVERRYAARVAFRNYRAGLIAAAALGGLSLLVSAVLGHVVVGLLVCVGLGLGVYNSEMLQRSALNLVASGTLDKGAMARSVLRRLAIVTAIALGIAFLYRPEGLAVLLGLAVYQLLSVGSVFGSLYRGLRRS